MTAPVEHTVSFRLSDVEEDPKSQSDLREHPVVESDELETPVSLPGVSKIAAFRPHSNKYTIWIVLGL